MFAFPHTLYQRNGAAMEPSYTYAGMTLKQFYVAHILAGLAANPVTMLNIEEHIEYAGKMAALAAKLPE